MANSVHGNLGLLATRVLYVLCLWVFVREGRAPDNQIGYGKIQPWWDEDSLS